MRRRGRLPRILPNAATAGSALLCAATVVLWVRSFGFVEGYQVVTARRLAGARYVHHTYGVRSTAGTIYVGVSRERGSLAPAETLAGRAEPHYYRLADESNVEDFRKRRVGFECVRARTASSRGSSPRRARSRRRRPPSRACSGP